MNSYLYWLLINDKPLLYAELSMIDACRAVSYMAIETVWEAA